MSPRAVVTGAFSYTGAAVARALIARGWNVHTLTNRAAPPGTDAITSAPLQFQSDHLRRELCGADLLVNTYWIRLPWAGQTFESAVERSRALIEAARDAGVRRLVHVSVSNAASGRNLGYYRGKADVEAIVRGAGLPYAIVSPTLVVGPSDVLTNNIAFFLRRFPLFPLPAAGRYLLQPVTLSDTARLIADAAEASDDLELDAAGPDETSFADYVRLVGRACGVERAIIGLPAPLVLGALRLIELWLDDVVLTREELLGLKQELLLSRKVPLGRESVAAWLLGNGSTLGTATSTM
jgi:uncharacterized protein YbjT (DUF2867 family)